MSQTQLSGLYLSDIISIGNLCAKKLNLLLLGKSFAQDQIKTKFFSLNVYCMAEGYGIKKYLSILTIKGRFR